MISRKGQKATNEGVVGKYIKKDTPPDLPSKFQCRTLVQQSALL